MGTILGSLIQLNSLINETSTYPLRLSGYGTVVAA